MTSTASAKATSHDATVQTSSDAGDGRKPHEIEYLRLRVTETADAVETIEKQMEGWKASLKAAKEAHRQATADLKAAEADS